jgi:uncharacterized protein
MTASRLLIALFTATACAAGTPQGESPSAGPSSGGEEGAVYPQSDCATEDVCGTRCDAKDAGACEWLGRMHETGEGAKQDYQDAAKYYRLACDGGRADSCAHLATIYEIGLVAGESSERAKELYSKACDQGNRWACKRVSQIDH